MVLELPERLEHQGMPSAYCGVHAMIRDFCHGSCQVSTTFPQRWSADYRNRSKLFHQEFSPDGTGIFEHDNARIHWMELCKEHQIFTPGRIFGDMVKTLQSGSILKDLG